MPLAPALQDLQHRLEQARTPPPDARLRMDASVLQPGADAILQLFELTLFQDHLTLSGTIVIAPASDDSALLVTGTAAEPLFDVDGMGVSCAFGVTGTTTLTLTVTLTPPSGWTFSTSFPELAASFFDAVPVTSPRFLLSTRSYADAELQVTVLEGASLFARPTGMTGPLAPALELINGAYGPPLPPLYGPLVEDSAARRLRMTMAFPDVRLQVAGIPLIAMTRPSLVLGDDYTVDPESVRTAILVQSDVMLGSLRLPLGIRLPDTMSTWQVGLLPGERVSLASLTGFLASVTGVDLLAALPANVLGLAGFDLSTFLLSFDLTTKTLRTLAVGVSSSPNTVWRLIPGLLELKDVAFLLTLGGARQGQGQVVREVLGTLSGTFRIARTFDVFGQIILPVGSGDWSLRTSPDLRLPSLGTLAEFVGGKDLARLLPGELGSVGAFTLTDATLVVDPAAVTLKRFGFTLVSSNDWVVIPQRLVLKDLFIRLDIARPLSAAEVTGTISGTIVIGSADVSVAVQRLVVGEDWTLQVSSPVVALPSVGALVDLLGTDLSSYLPTTLATASFSLYDLSIRLNLSQARMEQVRFALESDQPWPVITDILTIRKVGLSLNLSWADTRLEASLSAFGALEVVGTVIVVSAERAPDGQWTFRGELAAGEKVSLTGLVAQLLRFDSAYLPALEVEGLAVSFTPEGAFSFQGRTAGFWVFEVSSALTLKMRAAVAFERTQEGATSGLLAGDFFINNLQLSASYQFSPTSRTLLFRIAFGRLSLTASLTSGTNDQGQEYSLLEFRPGDLTLGEILEYLVRLAAPSLDFKLEAPWSALNQINLKNLSLVVDLKTRNVTVSYDVNVNLGFIDLRSIGLTYDRAAGQERVKLALSGRFLDQDYSIQEGRPLEWDVLNEPAPAVPAKGQELLDLRYLGLGQHVSFSDTTQLDSVGDVLAAMKADMKPARDASKNPLAEGNGSRMRFDRASYLLIGADFEILRTVSVGLIFNDPYLYGLRLALAGERAGSLAGLSFELLYKRITNDIGVFKVDLRVPDAFRQFEFGAVSITLPTIKVDVYTNGNFRVDLGFPHGGDFSDSFCVQVFPFIGYGGFYFAALTGATSERVPVITNGTFDPVIEFGIGLRVGLGKEIRKGPLSGGITVTVEGILEGTVAWFTPNDKALADAKYYWVQGTASIVGKLYATVDFAIIKVSVSLEARASVTLVIESYAPIHVELTVSVEAKASVSVLFITVSFSFHLELHESFDIGSARTPPWVLAPPAPPANEQAKRLVSASRLAGPLSRPAPQPRLRMQRGQHLRRSPVEAVAATAFSPEVQARALREAPGGAPRMELTPGLTWTPVAVFDGIQPVPLSLVPALTVAVADREDPPPGPPTLQVVLLLLAENSIAPDAVAHAEVAQPTAAHSARTSEVSELSFNLLAQAMLKWSIHALLGRLTGNVTRADLALLDTALREADTEQSGFSYENLADFFSKNFTFQLSPPPPDLSGASPGSGTLFPMIPALSYTTPDGTTLPFASHNPVTPQYEQEVAAYYAQLQVDATAGRADGPRPGDGATAREGVGTGPLAAPDSMATMTFREYFLMLARAAVQAALDRLESFSYPATSTDSLQSIAAHFPPLVTHIEVKAGDTVDSLCADFGMTREQFEDLNGGHVEDPLQPGTVLAVQLSVTPEGIALANARAPLQKDTDLSLSGVLYQVQQGDSLDTLVTQRFQGTGVTASALLANEANQRNSLLLRAGSTLLIAQPGADNGFASFLYTSAPGDGLASIAAFAWVRAQGRVEGAGVPWYAQTIADFNTDPGNPYAGPDLSGVIATGTVLAIPAALDDSNKAHALSYTTREGDTLSLVAGYFFVLQNQPGVLASLQTGLQGLNPGLPWSALPTGTPVKVPPVLRAVQAGDTLQSLAALFRVAPGDLTAPANLTASTLLAPLAVLHVPGVTHRVADGETLASVAANFNLTVPELASDVATVAGLFVPQTLTLPGVPQYDIGQLALDVATQSLANQVSAMMSRYFLHGLRLPPLPPLVKDFSGLYALTGQQLAAPPAASLPYALTFTKDAGASWIEFVASIITQPGDTAAALLARYPRIEALNRGVDFSQPLRPGLHLLTEDTDDLVVTLTSDLFSRYAPSTTFEPQVVSGPSAQTLFNLVPVRYTLPTNLHWQTPAPLAYGGASADQTPTTGEPSLWLFSGPLLRRIAEPSAGAATFGLFTAAGSDVADAEARPVTLFDWATLIEVQVRRIASTTSGAPLPNSYELVGTDPNGRDLLRRLFTYLDGAGSAEAGTALHVLYPPNADSNNAQGLASEAVDAASTFVLKTNLSTLTTSGVQRRAAVPLPVDTEVYSATLQQVADFLRLLWEGSVTNTGGYTLTYRTSAGGRGLPEELFSTGEDATLLLVVVLASASRAVNPDRHLRDFHNCALVGDNLDPSRESVFVQRTDDPEAEQVKLATVPPGNVGFELVRHDPDAEKESAEQRTRKLYSLLGFQVVAGGGFNASNAGLPAGPIELDDTHPVARQVDTPATALWHYQQIVPVARLTTTHALPTVPGLPDGKRDPYAGIAPGAQVSLTFGFVDVFGNRTPPATPLPDLPIPVGYFDELIGVAQWPGVASTYDFTGTSAAPVLQAALELQLGNYIPSGGNPLDAALRTASAHQLRLGQAYYQLWQGDVHASLETSLNQAPGAAPHSYEVDKLPLAGFVGAAYVFLGAARTQQPATVAALAGETLSTFATRVEGPSAPLAPAVAALGRANADLATSLLFAAPLAIPLFHVAAREDTLASIVQGVTTGGVPLTVTALATQNATVGLNAGVAVAAPPRTAPSTDATLVRLAQDLTCTVAGIATANAGTRGLLTEGKPVAFQGITLTVEKAAGSEQSESFNDLVTRFQAQAVTATPADLAVANQTVAALFVAGVPLTLPDYVLQPGDTFLRLQDAHPEFTIPAFSTAAQGSPNLFPSGAPLLLEALEPLPPSASTTLASIAEVQGLSLDQLTLFNATTALVEGALLRLADQVSLDATVPTALAPYQVAAGMSLDAVATAFGEASTLALAERNRTMRYVFAEAQPISVGTASTQTRADDSPDTVLARLLVVDPQVTFPDLVSAIAASTTLLRPGALLVCTLPSTGTTTVLDSLAARFNVTAPLLAQANAALRGFLAPGIPVTATAGGEPLTTRAGETFGTLVSRFKDEQQVETTVAALAARNGTVPGLPSSNVRFLLPPAAAVLPAPLGADYARAPTYPGTLFPLTAALALARSTGLIAPGFTDVPAVQRNRSALAPKADPSPNGATLSLQGFAEGTEDIFPGLKLATGGAAPGGSTDGGRQLWAVNFGPGGIRSVEMNSAPPTYFALPPLSNALKNEPQVPIRAFDPATGKLVPEQDPDLLDFQAVDLEVWARLFLGAVDLLLSPEYAVPAHGQSASALTRLVAAKKVLARKIADGAQAILATPDAASVPADARERLRQELLINLSQGYATDAILQFHTKAVSPFTGPTYTPDNAPRLSGRPGSRVHQTASQETLATLAARYQVTAVSLVVLLGPVTRILHTGAQVSFKGAAYTLTPDATLDSLRATVGATSAQDFADNLQAPDGLFAPETTLNIFGVRTQVSGSTGAFTGGTFDTLVDYFGAPLEDIVLANQEQPGIFIEGATIAIPGHPPVPVTGENNSLVKMAAAVGVDSPYALASAMQSQTGKLAPGFTVHLVRFVPEFTLSAAKTSLLDGGATANILLDVKSGAKQRKLLLDLEYRINELEHDIQTLAGTGGYQASSWLSFILPLTSSPSVAVDTGLGQLEVPLPLRAYPEAPSLVAQEGTASARKPTTLEEARAWRYAFSYQHQDAAQDTVYLSVSTNLRESLAARLAPRDGGPTFFDCLAQFVSAWPAMKAKLGELLTGGGAVDPVLAQTLLTFTEQVEAVAGTWAYEPPVEVVPSTPAPELVPGALYTYRVDFTVKAAPLGGGATLDTLTLSLVGSPPASPTGAFPDVRCLEPSGEWQSLTKDAETQTECVYKYPPDSTPAFVPLQHQLAFSGLDILSTQNALSGARVTRNEHLVSQGDTARAFLYATPLLSFSSVLTPLLTHDAFISFNEGAADLRQALADLFPNLLGASATEFPLKVSAQFGYPLVKPSSPDVEPLMPLLPIAFQPTAPYTTDFPTRLYELLARWRSGMPVQETEELYVLDVTVYSSLSTRPRPLLNLKRLGYASVPTARSRSRAVNDR